MGLQRAYVVKNLFFLVVAKHHGIVNAIMQIVLKRFSQTLNVLIYVKLKPY